MMGNNNKILTVSYGTFSCTLEGFEDSFDTMKAIAEYFRGLAAEDRFFGAVPPTPDAALMASIAERESTRRVAAHQEDGHITLRASETAPAQVQEHVPETIAEQVETPAVATAAPEPQAPFAQAAAAPVVAAAAAGGAATIAERLQRIRAVVNNAQDEEPAPQQYAEDEHSEEFAAKTADAPIAVTDIDDDAAPEVPEVENLEVDSLEVESTTYAEETASDPVAAASDDAAFEDDDFEAEQDSVEAEAVFESDDASIEDVNTVSEDFEAEATAEASEVVDTLDEEDLAEDIADDVSLTDAEDDLEEELVAEDPTEFDAADDAAHDAAAIQSAEDQANEIEAALAQLAADEKASEAIDEEAIDEVALADDSIAAAMASYSLNNNADEPGEDHDGAQDYAEAEFEDEDEEAFPSENLFEGEASEDSAEDDAAEDMAEPKSAIDAVAKQVADSIRRTRVIKVNRVDVEQAVQDGHIEAADDPESSLSDQDEAELMADLARVEAEDTPQFASEDLQGEAAETDEFAAEEAGVGSPEAEAETEFAAEEGAEQEPVAFETDVNRLMDEADQQMDEPESAKRRSAFQALKAAVAARKADKGLAKEADANDDSGAYRSDLAEVVQPRRPDTPEKTEERPARPAPLRLVAEQRVDVEGAQDEGPIRPRRVASSEDGAEEISEFADYAEEKGATELPDLLEAAASYLAFVEGKEQFSRPQLMTKVRQVEKEDFSREDGLRSFGQLLRAGKIEKVAGGRFAVTSEIGYRPDQREAG